MRGPTTTASSTQSTFIANKSKPHIQSFFASNLKKTTNNYPLTTKVTQQEILHDPIDQNNQKTIKKGTSAILPSSKTIQKVTSSRLALSKLALENLNKFYNNRTPSANAVAKPKSLSIPLGPKTFIEDGIKKTRNYVTLTYLSTKYRKTKEFYCFHDRDLKVPSEFSQKTIKHTCDNDCTTDEEQIKGGVKSLYKALQTYLEEEKTGKKRRPWMKDMVSSYWCLYNGIK